MTTPHEVLQNAVRTFLTPYFRNVFKNIYIKSCFDANNAEHKSENGSKLAYTEYMKGIRYCVENNVACQNSINVVDIIEESKKFCSEDVIKCMFRLIICDIFNSCMDLPENQISVDKFIRRIIMICCDFLQPNFEYFEHKHYTLVDDIVRSAIEHAMYRSLDLTLLTSSYIKSIDDVKKIDRNEELQKDLRSIKEHQKNIEIDIKNTAHVPVNPQQIPIQFIVPTQLPTQQLPTQQLPTQQQNHLSSDSDSDSDSDSTSKKHKSHSHTRSSSSSSSSSSSRKKKSSEKDSTNHEQISKLVFEGESASYNFATDKTDALNNELRAVNDKMLEMEKLKADFERQQRALETQNDMIKTRLDKKKMKEEPVINKLPMIQYGDATLGAEVKSLHQPTNSNSNSSKKIYESFDAQPIGL